MLEFEIQDQIMTRVDDSVVIARSEALKAHFEFKTDQWQPPYFAVFQGMKTDPYTVCLDWENNCIVPWEAIRYSGAMEVSLYSIPAYPTNRVKVKILDTGFDGCFPLPSPNIYDQLLFNKADEIDVEDGDVLLRAFGKEISRAKLPTGAGGGGEPGKAATIQVGQVTTGEPGSEAQVTNSGSENAAVFDFVIPRGEPGPKGDTGAAGPQGERGEQGPAGADGAQGLQGNPGQAATVQVGKVTTGESGSEAQVTNSGSENAAVFDFVIPRGEPGPKGDTGAAGPQGERGEQGPAGVDGIQGPQGESGQAATIQVGEVTTGEPGSKAQVTNSGSENAAVFDFVIPRGEPGAAGPQGERGEQGPAGSDGASGPQGDPGQAATIQVGQVTTGEPGSEAQVTNSGSESAAVFDFVIPRGEPGAAGPQGEQGPAGADGAQGPKGESGQAATIQVGKVTTGEPGSEAQVTNSGSESTAVFDFAIPRGEPGAAGPQGERGEQGPAGADGAQGPQGDPGQAATIQVGEVTTGEPGSKAQVTNSGSESAAVFDFVIPRGEPGPKGDTGAAGPQGERGEQGPAGADGAQGLQGNPGQAATIQVGKVTTGEPGSEVQVTNSGSESAAVFDFVIPRGEPGAAGPQGERGEQGPAGQGIPAGGSAGQIPSKVDGSDYNLHWITPPGVYIESYVGNDESERTINLKVTPKCVFVFGENTALTMNDMTTPSINLCYSGAAAQGKGSLGLSLNGNMLKVNNDPDLSMAQTRRKLNSFGVNYIVLAWN